MIVKSLPTLNFASVANDEKGDYVNLDDIRLDLQNANPDAIEGHIGNYNLRNTFPDEPHAIRI